MHGPVPLSAPLSLVDSAFHVVTTVAVKPKFSPLFIKLLHALDIRMPAKSAFMRIRVIQELLLLRLDASHLSFLLSFPFTDIHLADVDITAPLMKAFDKVRDTKVISLPNCWAHPDLIKLFLSRVAAPEKVSLAALRTLDDGGLDVLNPVKLRELSLAGCFNLTPPPLRNFFSRVPHTICALDISGTDYDDSVLALVAALPLLTVLSIGYRPPTLPEASFASILEGAAFKTILRTLRLHFCDITVATLNALLSYASLQKLDLDGNPRLKPHDLAGILGTGRVTELRVVHTDIAVEDAQLICRHVAVVGKTRRL
jgi:hypothetical protein